MQFTVDEELYRLFPGLKIGVLVLKIDNTKYGEDRLEPVLADVLAHFPCERPQDHLNIKVWREAFGKLGVSGSKYPSSVEALVRRVLKGGPFPRINPVVDLYNAVSLKHLVPMGGHALSAVTGDISLGFAAGTESFAPMDSMEKETVVKGEVVYKDATEVLTRRWVWRQCEKDKVSVSSHSVFVPIDVMPGLPEGLTEAAMKDMEEWLGANGNGRVVHRDILTIERPATSF